MHLYLILRILPVINPEMVRDLLKVVRDLKGELKKINGALISHEKKLQEHEEELEEARNAKELKLLGDLAV